MNLKDKSIKSRKQLNEVINTRVRLINKNLYCFISDEDEFNIYLETKQDREPLLLLEYYKNRLICEGFNKEYALLCRRILVDIYTFCNVSNIKNYVK